MIKTQNVSKKQWYSHYLAGAAMGRSGVEVGSSHIHATNDEIGSNVTLSNQPIRVAKKVQQCSKCSSWWMATSKIKRPKRTVYRYTTTVESHNDNFSKRSDFAFFQNYEIIFNPDRFWISLSKSPKFKNECEKDPNPQCCLNRPVPHRTSSGNYVNRNSSQKT